MSEVIEVTGESALATIFEIVWFLWLAWFFWLSLSDIKAELRVANRQRQWWIDRAERRDRFDAIPRYPMGVSHPTLSELKLGMDATFNRRRM